MCVCIPSDTPKADLSTARQDPSRLRLSSKISAHDDPFGTRFSLWFVSIKIAYCDCRHLPPPAPVTSAHLIHFTAEQRSSSFQRTSRSGQGSGARRNEEQRELTRRGRTSTISSGTRKISAFIFLAIDIANFAAEKSR